MLRCLATTMLMYTLSLFDFITLDNIRICNIGKKDGSEVIELAIIDSKDNLMDVWKDYSEYTFSDHSRFCF